MNPSVSPALTRNQTEDLIRRLLAKDDLDFVAYVTTQWVSLGVQAAMAALGERHSKLRGVIFICSVDEGRFLVGADEIVVPEGCSVDIFYLERFVPLLPSLRRRLYLFTNFFSFLGRSANAGKSIFIIEPLYPRIGSFSWLSRKYRLNAKFYIIDEGFLSYGSIKLRIVNIFFEQPGVSLNAKIHAAIATFVQVICAWPLRLKGAVRCFFLFQRRAGNTFLEGDIASKYRNLLDRKQEGLPVASQGRRRLLVITQPYLQHYAPELVEEALHRIREICLKYDISFDLKLHPREVRDGLPPRYSAHGDAVLQGSQNVEELLAGGGYAGVIGWSSTSLLTSEALYSVPAFSLLHIVPTRPGNIFVRQLNDEFSKFSKDVIRFPDSWELCESALADVPFPKKSQLN